jgi:hypothetical protein
MVRTRTAPHPLTWQLPEAVERQKVGMLRHPSKLKFVLNNMKATSKESGAIKNY